MNGTKKSPAQTLKNFFAFIPKYLGILIGMGVLGILLLTIAYSFPVNQVMKESSLAHSDSMGWAPLVNNPYTQYQSYFTSYEPGILDDATDKIILTNCFDEGEDSAIVRAADMNDYGRYWHGYVSILRFIFYFIDYWDFLLFNSLLQLFLLGCVGYSIFKVTGKKRYLLAFFSSCAFLTPAATGMSLQYTPVFYISMLGSLFCLLKSDWILQKNRRYFLFLFLGIITCYFDFLTYPLLSFAFPFCWLMVATEDKLTLKSRLCLLFGGGCSFIFGYGGFFVAKWIIQAIILNNGNFFSGLTNVFFHVSGLEDKYRLLHQNYCRIDSLYNNFRHYLYPAFILILGIWICIMIYKFLQGRLHPNRNNIIFIAITLTSPAWYFILNTHTGIHHLFTYRIYAASMLGFMLFVCGAINQNHKEVFSIRTCIKRLSILALCLLLGVCASRIAKEDLITLNGGEHTELLLSENDVLEFEFTPSMPEIKGFSFCIHTNSSIDGELHINIYDNDDICETLTIPIASYQEQNYVPQLTDWNLKPGKQYIMKVYITNNTAGIRLLVTPEGNKPQAEYGNAFLNQKPMADIAPLSGIIYRGNVQTIYTKLYLSVCGGTFFLIWFLSICAFWKNKADWLKQ